MCTNVSTGIEVRATNKGFNRNRQCVVFLSCGGLCDSVVMRKVGSGVGSPKAGVRHSEASP